MARPALDETLEIFGQQSGAGVTTPFVFCYRLEDSADLSPIISVLRAGLGRLTDTFPWVAGRIVGEGITNDSSGAYKIRDGERTPRLLVRDLRLEPGAPAMEQLEAREFPVTMLPESVLSPIKVLPGDTDEDRSPVLQIQLNRIRGGLLLNLVGNHQALDGTGQEQVAFLLNKACQGLPFTEEEARVGNLARSTIVPLLDDAWQPSPDSRYSRAGLEHERSEGSTAAAPSTTPRWTDVLFAGGALAALKAKANGEVGRGFVSTDDALTALVWRALSRARLARLPETVTSTMARAIDPRRYLGIPPSYPGYIFNMAYTEESLRELGDRTLGSVASSLRAAVDPVTSGLDRTTREFATLLHRASDKNRVSANDGLDLGRDIMVSSWANMRCYHLDFGMQLGLPVAFRRTLMVPVPSLVYFLPKRDDGEIVVTMCICDEDLVRMEGDEEFTRFGRFLR